MNKELIDKYVFNSIKYGSKAEQLLLSKLMMSNIDFKYKYKVPNDITYYMANFYIPHKNIIINISLSINVKQAEIVKDDFCKSKGFKVIRILESNISSFDISSVL
jgi:very-short-patch-repair endonuclease